jgi:hypothetical protein
MDFETNAYGNNKLNDTAFCGTGSQSNYLFLNNVNITVQFQFVIIKG